MATTSNYGWTTPDDSSLVKDGASAIRTLGSAIDTSLNTALGTKKAGLVLLNTTSFSGVASQSINDVFSANYTNYRVLINSVNASTGSLRMRLRVSGSDDTNSTYISAYSVEQVGGATATRVTDGATTSWAIAQSSSTNDCSVSLDIYNPFVSDKTYGSYFNMIRDGASYYILSGGAVFTSATSFTGLTIFTGTNTMTGQIQVFGYNK